jgi:hypothetical protein
MRMHLAEIEGFVSVLYGRCGILRLTKKMAVLTT